MIADDLRGFINESLSHTPDGKRYASAQPTPMLRAYAEGINDGVEMALTQVLQYLDSVSTS